MVVAFRCDMQYGIMSVAVAAVKVMFARFEMQNGIIQNWREHQM